MDLEGKVRRYVRKVIGMSLPLHDSPQPGTDGRKIFLPLSRRSLEEFFSREFVDAASEELLFSIVVGLAYHEAGHIISGEEETDPKVISNLISEANDFTVVPRRWPGSIPFTLAAVNASYRQARDLASLPLNTKQEKLGAMFGLCLCYLRKLRVKYEGRDVRKLPEDHPLHPYFERAKPILREARRCPVSQRPKLVKALYEILRDLWGKEEGLEQALELAEGELELGKLPLGAGDAIGMEEEMERQGRSEEIRREIEGLEHGRGGSEEDVEGPSQESLADPEVASEIRRVVQSLMLERTLARMVPSTRGERFCPGRFYEVKTRPEAPRVRRIVLRMSRRPQETEVVLCFDRSGSMAGEKERTAQKLAATFCRALFGVPELRFQLLGFNHATSLVKGREATPLERVLRMIPLALKAQGGTDLPLALSECLKLLRGSRAKRKLMFLLTDGDIYGSLDLRELVERCRGERIELTVIGVKGSDPNALRDAFGEGNVVYVEKFEELPSKLKELILRKI